MLIPFTLKSRFIRINGIAGKITGSKLFRIFFFFLLFLQISNMFFYFPSDPDLGWHLTYGRQIIERRSLPTTDEFSHTHFGKDYKNSEWMTDLMHYFVFEKSGLLGLAVFSAIFTALGIFIPLMLFPGSPLLKYAVGIVSAYVSSYVFAVGVRSQNVSFFFMGIFIGLIFLYEETGNKKTLLMLPPLFFLWMIFHPVYLIGYLFLIIYIATKVMVGFTNKVKGYKLTGRGAIFPLIIAIGVLAIFAVIPRTKGTYFAYGTDIVKGLLLPAIPAMNTSEYGMVRTNIAEWQPLTFGDLRVLLFIFLVIFSFYLFTDNKRRNSYVYLVFLCFFTYFASLYKRNVALFFPFFIPFSLIFLKKYSGQVKFQSLLFLVITSFLFLYLPWTIGIKYNSISFLLKDMDSYCRQMAYPCKAIGYLKEKNLQGNMYNDYTWGGYLVWKMPEHRTFIDGRLFSLDIFEEYKKVAELKSGWQDILRKYRVNFIFVPPKSIFYEYLKEHDGWEKEYEDDRAMILVRKNPIPLSPTPSPAANVQ